MSDRPQRALGLDGRHGDTVAPLSRSQRRGSAQVCFDILRAIHSIGKTGRVPTKYQIERICGLTHTRLQGLLASLVASGLLEDGVQITPQGYEFMTEVASKVRPVLSRYGLWQDEI